MKKLIRIKIPGAQSTPRDPGAQLIEDFLWVTEEMEDEQAAEIAGVSVATLARWRRSGSHRLRGDLRRRMERYVRGAQRERKRDLRAA